MRGYLDQFRVGIISGWAYDPLASRGVDVSILIDGGCVATVPATIHRPDLVAAGIGDGWSGFCWIVPERFADGRLHTLEVVFRGTDVAVPNGRQHVVFEVTSRMLYSELMRRLIPRGIWSLDTTEIRAGTLAFTGWAAPPLDVPTAFAVSVNGAFVSPLGKTPQFIPRFDTEIIRFEGRIGVADLETDARGLCFRPHFGPRLQAEECLAFHLPSGATVLPDAARQMRVQGVHDDHAFNRTGYSTAIKMNHQLDRLRGRPLGPGDRVLDWGIGCGRVARFVAGMVPGGLRGADIDAENVAWCNAHVPNVSAVAIRQDPPMPFADSSFDVVYGISVFTHLDERDESVWLHEIDRVLAPGGVALVTTHGDTAWWRNQTLGPVAFANWQRSGLMVVGTNTNLKDVAIDGSRYLDTFTTRRHVADRWGLRFDVLDHLEGLIECNQDLIVLQSRKRTG